MTGNRRAYIIRVWQTENGRVVGQLSDPAQGWRYPFRSAEDLWRMIAGNSPSSHHHPDARSASPTEGEQP